MARLRTVVAQKAEASAALDFERDVVQSMHGLTEPEKTGGVGLAQIGYGNEAFVTGDSGLIATQLREPVEYVEEEQRVVSVTVCRRHNMIAVPSHDEKQKRIYGKPNKGVG